MPAFAGMTMLLVGALGHAQEPAAKPDVSRPAASKSLDELLEAVRTTDLRDSRENAAREARFKAARDQQAQLLRDAEAEKTRLENLAAAKAKEFEDNDRLIGDQSQARDAKAGNLGELFGVLRQSAGDFATAVRNSLITAQLPDRVAIIDRLAQTKSMPPMEDLQRFWYELQREMTESGKIVRFDAVVTELDGAREQQAVTRIGPFVAVADGRFLEYQTIGNSLTVPPKQPPGRFGDVAQEFERSDDGYQPMVVDPTRGVLLSLYSLRPDLLDRIELGGAVGYIIIAVGLIGALLALFQFGYLLHVGRRVERQLEDLSQIRLDNPLGRVLAAFKGSRMPANEEAEVVELRISEAVMRELPPITRIQSFLKLAVAAGPLLGLVGTVIGMIETFQAITESGSGDPKMMAAGIGQAMIATVLGLGIAIPLLFINSALAGRSKRIVQVLDEQSTGLLAETMESRLAHG